jgi:hypothetical protein
MSKSYDTDFYAWALHNAQLLREGKFSEIDIEHIIEELESMGKSDKRELTSRLKILIAHLLKWEYQPKRRGRSWKRSIDEQRIQITDLLSENPSLKSLWEEAKTNAYPDAVKLAVKETKLSSFPTTCLYTTEELLDEDFYPGETE